MYKYSIGLEAEAVPALLWQWHACGLHSEAAHSLPYPANRSDDNRHHPGRDTAQANGTNQDSALWRFQWCHDERQENNKDLMRYGQSNKQ